MECVVNKVTKHDARTSGDRSWKLKREKRGAKKIIHQCNTSHNARKTKRSFWPPCFPFVHHFLTGKVIIRFWKWKNSLNFWAVLVLKKNSGHKVSGQFTSWVYISNTPVKFRKNYIYIEFGQLSSASIFRDHGASEIIPWSQGFRKICYKDYHM